jgi:hypothetical protein
MIVQDGILPLNFEPEVGDIYETHNNHVRGKVIEKVRNRTGSVRLNLQVTEKVTRWTTWVPSHD